MAKKTLKDIEVAGKRVLVRVDFNVPFAEGQQISDQTRIIAALPGINYLLEQGAAVVLMSHLGRPKGQRVEALSLAPVAQRLSQLLERPVQMGDDCVGEVVEKQVAQLVPGQVLLLENLRFHREEEANDPGFARALAALGQVYVNDAFGAAHRAHASTEGIVHHLPVAVSGFLMEKEIQYLYDAVSRPKRPFITILGGAKVSGKIDVIEHLLDKVDALIIGGGMAYTFFKAQGLEIGNSLLEEERIEIAAQVLQRAEALGVELLLPVDCVVADGFAAEAQTQIVAASAMPPQWEGLDIGPESRRLFGDKISKARTVIWNGPLGVFELAPFAAGTLAVAQALGRATAEAGAVSIIGGGDTASAIVGAGLQDQMTHISTGGGASLECLAGNALPGVDALDEVEA